MEKYSAHCAAIAICLNLLAFLAASSAAKANEDRWSFELYPPSYEENLEIWSEEIEAVANRFHATPCNAFEEVAYAKYQARFPEYRSLANQPGMREAWLQAAIAGEIFTNCYYLNLDKAIDKTFRSVTGPHTDLSFCGNFSRSPEDEHESRAIGSVMLLMQLANSGRLRALEELLELEQDHFPTIRFDGRFRHYFQTIFEDARGDKPQWLHEHGWLKSAARLTVEKRHAVDKLARDRDLVALLAMLPLCEPAVIGEVWP